MFRKPCFSSASVSTVLWHTVLAHSTGQAAWPGCGVWCVVYGMDMGCVVQCVYVCVCIACDVYRVSSCIRDT